MDGPEADRHLKPIGFWDLIWRGSFEIEHRGSRYVVDADYFDLRERIDLYRDGNLDRTESSPAEFAIDEDTKVVAAMSLLGMKYVDLVEAGGRRTSFKPRKGTGEERRIRFARNHPRINRVAGVVAWLILAFALVTQIPALFDLTVGRLTDLELPTIWMPAWANVTLSVAGILAGLDRALQLKHNRWLDD